MRRRSGAISASSSRAASRSSADREPCLVISELPGVASRRRTNVVRARMSATSTTGPRRCDVARPRPTRTACNVVSCSTTSMLLVTSPTVVQHRARPTRAANVRAAGSARLSVPLLQQLLAARARVEPGTPEPVAVRAVAERTDRAAPAPAQREGASAGVDRPTVGTHQCDVATHDQRPVEVDGDAGRNRRRSALARTFTPPRHRHRHPNAGPWLRRSGPPP